MTKKAVRIERALARQQAIINEAEENRKKAKPTLGEEIIIQKADVLLFAIKLKELEADLQRAHEDVNQNWAVVEGNLRHTVIDGCKCEGCGSGSPTYALPWAVIFKVLEKEGIHVPMGEFKDRIAGISPEGMKKTLYCQRCMADVERFLAGLPYANDHESNARLHPRDSVLKRWLEERINKMKKGAERRVPTVEGQITNFLRRKENAKRNLARLLKVSRDRATNKVALERADEKRQQKIANRFNALATA